MNKNPRFRNWRAKTPEIKQALYEMNRRRWDQLKADGLCKGCMAPLEDISFVCCEKCRRRAGEQLKIRRAALKLRVLEHYGNSKCVCCGMEGATFLTIDHINNDGNVHRKEIGYGNDIYHWLEKNNYPEGFQVLCWNCNMGKHINGGICPHKDNASD